MQCRSCLDLFETEETLLSHIRIEHTGWIPHECVLCPQTFLPTDTVLDAHYAKMHPDRTPKSIFSFDRYKAKMSKRILSESLALQSSGNAPNTNISTSNIRRLSSFQYDNMAPSPIAGETYTPTNANKLSENAADDGSSPLFPRDFSYDQSAVATDGYRRRTDQDRSLGRDKHSTVAIATVIDSDSPPNFRRRNSNGSDIEWNALGADGHNIGGCKKQTSRGGETSTINRKRTRSQKDSDESASSEVRLLHAAPATTESPPDDRPTRRLRSAKLEEPFEDSVSSISEAQTPARQVNDNGDRVISSLTSTRRRGRPKFDLTTPSSVDMLSTSTSTRGRLAGASVDSKGASATCALCQRVTVENSMRNHIWRFHMSRRRYSCSGCSLQVPQMMSLKRQIKHWKFNHPKNGGAKWLDHTKELQEEYLNAYKMAYRLQYSFSSFSASPRTKSENRAIGSGPRANPDGENEPSDLLQLEKNLLVLNAQTEEGHMNDNAGKATERQAEHVAIVDTSTVC